MKTNTHLFEVNIVQLLECQRRTNQPAAVDKTSRSDLRVRTSKHGRTGVVKGHSSDGVVSEVVGRQSYAEGGESIQTETLVVPTETRAILHTFILIAAIIPCRMYCRCLIFLPVYLVRYSSIFPSMTDSKSDVELALPRPLLLVETLSCCTRAYLVVRVPICLCILTD